MLLHLVDNVGSVRQGERCGHAVPYRRASGNQGIAHQRVNTVRGRSHIWAVDPTVVVVPIGVIAVVAILTAKGNVVIVQNDVLIDFHHAGLPGW